MTQAKSNQRNLPTGAARSFRAELVPKIGKLGMTFNSFQTKNVPHCSRVTVVTERMSEFLPHISSQSKQLDTILAKTSPLPNQILNMHGNSQPMLKTSVLNPQHSSISKTVDHI